MSYEDRYGKNFHIDILSVGDDLKQSYWNGQAYTDSFLSTVKAGIVPAAEQPLGDNHPAVAGDHESGMVFEGWFLWKDADGYDSRALVDKNRYFGAATAEMLLGFGYRFVTVDAWGHVHATTFNNESEGLVWPGGENDHLIADPGLAVSAHVSGSFFTGNGGTDHALTLAWNCTDKGVALAFSLDSGNLVAAFNTYGDWGANVPRMETYLRLHVGPKFPNAV